MEVNSISKGYRDYNEDMVIVIKDHLFVVVDSATALCPPAHLPSDGVFLLKELKKELLDLYNSHKLTGKNFVKQMNNISKRIYSRYIKGHKDLKEKYQFPDASMAIVYIDVCDVHFYSVGDCSSFIRFKNGKTRYISDRSVPLLNQQVVEHYHALGINQFDEMYELLRYNRSLLNKGGRRSMYSLYKKPNIKFKHELYDIRELEEVYLCSDGYYEAFDTFKLYKSRRDLFNSSHDLQSVYKNIVKASELDKNMEKYPRLKQIDDISAIRVVF